MAGMNSTDLESRHAAEKNFHDRKLSKQKNLSYYDMGFSKPIFDQMMGNIGNIKGKNVLEFGCGEGWFTEKLADMGAEVWAFDLSKEAVKKTKERFSNHSAQKRVHVDQMPGENLSYDSEQFDIVVGLAILHHLELEASMKEIRRILKNGGRAFFMEPLGHNLFLNLYRKMTPHLRSKDEMPMILEQFDLIDGIFPKFRHEEYYLLTVFALFFYFLGANRVMLKSRDLLIKLDRALLKMLPGIRKYCWYSILEMEK